MLFKPVLRGNKEEAMLLPLQTPPQQRALPCGAGRKTQTLILPLLLPRTLLRSKLQSYATTWKFQVTERSGEEAVTRREDISLRKSGKIHQGNGRSGRRIINSFELYLQK